MDCKDYLKEKALNGEGFCCLTVGTLLQYWTVQSTLVGAVTLIFLQYIIQISFVFNN